MRRPLILTGGPAVGKTTTGRVLAAGRARCAFLDVDDLRHLVVAGHRAPWEGPDGAEQQQVGVTNACALVHNFAEAGIESVVTDVLTPATLLAYRTRLPDVLVLRLSLSLDEARARASRRAVHLTAAEFDALHEADRTDPPAADMTLDVSGLSVAEQVTQVERVWATASGCV